MDKELLSIGEAAKMLGVTARTLQRWDASGRLKAQKSAGGHRYYVREELLRLKTDLEAVARVWAESVTPQILPSEQYCETQDRFRARLNTMAVLMDRDVGAHEIAPLIIAMVGELGNNAFDHNIGNWPDVMGIFFAYDLQKRIVVIADRGVGVLATLRRVRPALQDDMEAMQVAMTERVSGRTPEQRGNGLKFVRAVATQTGTSVTLQSGIARATISQKGKYGVGLAERNIRGVLAVIVY